MSTLVIRREKSSTVSVLFYVYLKSCIGCLLKLRVFVLEIKQAMTHPLGRPAVVTRPSRTSPVLHLGPCSQSLGPRSSGLASTGFLCEMLTLPKPGAWLNQRQNLWGWKVSLEQVLQASPGDSQSLPAWPFPPGLRSQVAVCFPVRVSNLQGAKCEVRAPASVEASGPEGWRGGQSWNLRR